MASAQINGHPALIMRVGDQIEGVLAVRTEDSQIAGLYITGLYFVRNPEKLSRVEQETTLRR